MPAGRLRSALLAVVPMSFVFGVAWYLKWLVVQGYPPLRIASVTLAIGGALGLVIGIIARRAMATLHARAAGQGAPPPRPTPRDWIVCAAHGLLVFPAMIGVQAVAVTRVPLAIVAALAYVGFAWRAIIGGARGAAAMTSAALATAAAVLFAVGPDRGGAVLFALLLIAPLWTAVGGRVKDRALSAPGHEVRAIAWLTGAVTLQLAGLVRGEEFDGVPTRATLALLGDLAIAAVLIVLSATVGRTGHAGIIGRSAAGGVAVAAVIGHAWCDQVIAASTIAAVGLVIAAILARPPASTDA